MTGSDSEILKFKIVDMRTHKRCGLLISNKL